MSLVWDILAQTVADQKCRNIYLKPKKAGGMKINFQNPPKNLDEKMVYNILRDYKILNCEVLIRDDEATVDDLIDVIMKNHRTYIKVSLNRGALEFPRHSYLFYSQAWNPLTNTTAVPIRLQ